jgi:hypothetical protein
LKKRAAHRCAAPSNRAWLFGSKMSRFLLVSRPWCTCCCHRQLYHDPQTEGCGSIDKSVTIDFEQGEVSVENGTGGKETFALGSAEGFGVISRAWLRGRF